MSKELVIKELEKLGFVKELPIGGVLGSIVIGKNYYALMLENDIISFNDYYLTVGSLKHYKSSLEVNLYVNTDTFDDEQHLKGIKNIDDIKKFLKLWKGQED